VAYDGIKSYLKYRHFVEPNKIDSYVQVF